MIAENQTLRDAHETGTLPKRCGPDTSAAIEYARADTMMEPTIENLASQSAYGQARSMYLQLLPLRARAPLWQDFGRM